MAGPRGYYTYRGRKSKGKIALTVLLIMVILAAVVVMLLQRHVVYDENGSLRLELPWQTEESAKNEEIPKLDEVDLNIEVMPEDVPFTQPKMRAYAMPTGVLTKADWEETRLGMQAKTCEAVAVTLKDRTGNIYFDTDAAVTYSVKTAEDSAETLAEIVSGEGDCYTIARISCFQDPKAADSHTKTMGLMNTGGYIFYDGNNSRWLDPGKAETQSYLRALIQDAAELGFDEILLTDVCYPLVGKLDKIQYGEGDRSQNLMRFLEEARAMLEPYRVALSVAVTEPVLSEGQDDIAGLVLTDIVSVADRIYVQAGPETAEDYAAAVREANDMVVLVPEMTAEEAADFDCVLIYE